MIIEDNYIEGILFLSTAISTAWAIRARLRAYKTEDTKDIEERAEQKTEVKTLKEQVSQLEARVMSLESERHEVRVLTAKVDSIYSELDKKIDNLIAIIVNGGKK